MAYARLIFPLNTPVLKKLKDIAKVVIGAATSVSQLEFATQSSSEIITTEPAGWTMIDTALEVSGTATISEYRMSAPCVNATKTKYASLSATSNLYSVTVNYSSAVPTIITVPTASSTTGTLQIPVGTGVAASSLTNAVWRTKALYQFTSSPSGVYTYSASGAVDLSATEIYISVTARKLLVFGIADICAYSCVLEFPETPYTTKWGNLPTLHLSASYAAAADGAISAKDFTANSFMLNSNSPSSASYRMAAFTNWYNSLDGLRKNRDATDGLAASLSSIYMPVVAPYSSIGANGNPAIVLSPITDIRTTKFEGIHEYSKLTEIYSVTKPAGQLLSGEQIIVGPDTYIILTGGAGINSANRSICIKKA